VLSGLGGQEGQNFGGMLAGGFLRRGAVQTRGGVKVVGETGGGFTRGRERIGVCILSWGGVCFGGRGFGGFLRAFFV